MSVRLSKNDCAGRPEDEAIMASRFTVKTKIHAPIDVVFKRLTDFEHAADRIEGITKMEMLTEGPVGVGTRFKETRLFMRKEATEEMEVTSFQQPTGYSLGCESCGCQYDTDFKLTPADGGTEVEMRFRAQPLTLGAKVMSVIFKPMVKSVVKTCEKDLDDIKRSIEQDAAAG